VQKKVNDDKYFETERLLLVSTVKLLMDRRTYVLTCRFDDLVHLCKEPLYDGKKLDEAIREVLGSGADSPSLKQTLTNIVIPAYDVKANHPIVFSSNDVLCLAFFRISLLSTIAH
jgi:hypothetical protein